MDSVVLRKFLYKLPEIETERLILKKISRENAVDMNEYASIESVTKYLLWNPHLNMRETEGFIDYLQKQYRKGVCGDWGLNIKSSGKFIGTCGFVSFDEQNNKSEIGYVLSPYYSGQGYMSEAVKAVLKVAFETLMQNRVELRIMEGNEKSIKLALKNGFTDEGTFRQELLVKGQYRTIRHFAKLRTDHFAGK